MTYSFPPREEKKKNQFPQLSTMPPKTLQALNILNSASGSKESRINLKRNVLLASPSKQYTLPYKLTGKANKNESSFKGSSDLSYLPQFCQSGQKQLEKQKP